MSKAVLAILGLVLVVLAVMIGSVVIRDGAEILTSTAQYIMHLFGRADLNPRNGRGFACFIQLIAIAIFTGWAIKRFMNYFGRKSENE